MEEDSRLSWTRIPGRDLDQGRVHEAAAGPGLVIDVVAGVVPGRGPSPGRGHREISLGPGPSLGPGVNVIKYRSWMARQNKLHVFVASHYSLVS